MAHVVVDLHEQESKLPGEKHVATTTTTFKDGKATVETRDSQRTIGLDGVTTTNTTQTETIGKKGSARTSKENKTNVSFDSVSSSQTDQGGKGRQEGPQVLDGDVEHAPGRQGRRHRVLDRDGDQQGRLLGLVQGLGRRRRDA